jgi:hypothetical protein
MDGLLFLLHQECHEDEQNVSPLKIRFSGILLGRKIQHFAESPSLAVQGASDLRRSRKQR